MVPPKGRSGGRRLDSRAGKIFAADPDGPSGSETHPAIPADPRNGGGARRPGKLVTSWRDHSVPASPALRTISPSRAISVSTNRRSSSGGRRIDRDQALTLDELLAHVRLAQHHAQVGMQLVDDRPRHLGGRHQHPPGRRVVAGHADLGERRHIRNGADPLLRGHAEHAHLAAVHERQARAGSATSSSRYARRRDR